jgi:hypothetical protein
MYLAIHPSLQCSLILIYWTLDKKINLRNLLTKAFRAEKLDLGAGLGTIVGAGLGNRLTPNWTTKPTLFSTAIAPKKCERLGQGGFCRKVIGDSINFVPKPAPTLGFMSQHHILILT